MAIKLLMECYVDNEAQADKVAELICETFHIAVSFKTEAVNEENDNDD